MSGTATGAWPVTVLPLPKSKVTTTFWPERSASVRPISRSCVVASELNWM